MNVFPRFWADLTSADFEHLDPARAVAVLPLGATEQHGPHLPLSVDTVLVEGVVREALGHLAPTTQVLVLPTQTIGLSTEHTAFAGTLSLSPETLIRMWIEIGESGGSCRAAQAGAVQCPWRQCRAHGHRGARIAGPLQHAGVQQQLVPAALGRVSNGTFL